MGEFNVNKTTGGLNPTAGMPETYPAEQVMMSDGVTSVEDRISANTMSVPTDIPYNTLYIAPNDGYVRIGGSSGTITGDIKILASDNQEYSMERIINQYEFKSIFVRKGMKVKWVSDPANKAVCRFYSLS